MVASKAFKRFLKTHCIICEEGALSVRPGAVNMLCKKHLFDTFKRNILGVQTVTPIVPVCFGSNPNAQEQAENDCGHCMHELVCLTAQPSYTERVIRQLCGPMGRAVIIDEAHLPKTKRRTA